MITECVIQSINQSVTRSSDQPINQPTNQPTHQPVSIITTLSSFSSCNLRLCLVRGGMVYNPAHPREHDRATSRSVVPQTVDMPPLHPTPLLLLPPTPPSPPPACSSSTPFPSPLVSSCGLLLFPLCRTKTEQQTTQQNKALP